MNDFEFLVYSLIAEAALAQSQSNEKLTSDLHDALLAERDTRYRRGWYNRGFAYNC